jgi:4-hydroxy 2-oxovalerate aldolase
LIEAANSTQLLINILYKAGVRELWLAGADGYLQHGENYFDRLFENRVNIKNNTSVHEDMRQKLITVSQSMTLHFVTESIYQKYM